MNNTTPATSVAAKASSSNPKKSATAFTELRSGFTTTNVKIAKQRGKSTLNSPQQAETMTLDKSNFPFIGSAVLYLNSLHHGEFLDRLNVVSRHDPEWIRNIADIMMAFDWENEEEKKLMFKWSLKEKYVTAVNA